MCLALMSDDGAIVDVEGDVAGESLLVMSVDAWVCVDWFEVIGA